MRASAATLRAKKPTLEAAVEELTALRCSSFRAVACRRNVSAPSLDNLMRLRL